MRSPNRFSCPLASTGSVARSRRTSTTSRVTCSLDQRARRALGDDVAAVHDHEPIAELLGFVHVVRGEHERDALALQAGTAGPKQVARLRVEAGRRLVEQEHVGRVDQPASDREPSLHAARERVDLGVAPVAQLHEVEQLGGPLADERSRQVEVAAVDHHVVPHRQLGVEVVLLRHDAEARADLRAVGRGVHAEHAEFAARPRRHAADHAHRRRLARAVRSEEAERLAGFDREVDAVDGHERRRSAS